jgi:predicted component of type VI protein secretion system
MSRVDARVQVVDTETGWKFTQRFDTTPIRIGRALSSDLLLPHAAIAGRHGEISIGLRVAYFRSRAWLRSTWIDGVQAKRGRSIKLTQDSVITIGPFEVKVAFRVRDRRYERERAVTPLALPVLGSDPPARSEPRFACEGLAERARQAQVVQGRDRRERRAPGRHR